MTSARQPGGRRRVLTHPVLTGALVVLLAVAVLVGCADPGTQAPGQRETSAGVAGDQDGDATAVTVPAQTAAPVPAPALSPLPPPPSAQAGAVAPASGAGAGPSGGSGADPGTGFVWTVSPVTAADLPHSWRQGCPVPPSALRAVTVGYHSMGGGVRTGVLVVHQDLVEPARRAFARLFEIGFPFTSIRPVDDFGGDDDRSMAADNTSAFNCRAAVSDGPTSWSQHAYGRAIDVNPLINPYVLNGRVLPPEGARYADRRPVPGMVTRGSDALKAFTDNGFTWGGTWSNPDYQHLQR